MFLNHFNNRLSIKLESLVFKRFHWLDDKNFLTMSYRTRGSKSSDITEYQRNSANVTEVIGLIPVKYKELFFKEYFNLKSDRYFKIPKLGSDL